MDKSVDKYNVNSLFVTVRYMARSIRQLKAGFLRECHSEIRGASGMADALRKRIDCMKLEELLKSNLVRLTTDGESTNIGRHA